VAFLYRAFGLAVASDFELPELDPETSGGPADLVVVFGDGATPDPGDYCPHGLTPPSIVVLGGPSRTFRISGGSRIELWEHDPSAREMTRAVLMGVAFSVAVYQRGMWPLHVSGSLVDRGVWFFGGPSGAGKSTIVSWLNANAGLPVVTDDAAVVRLDGDTVRAAVASRALRLLPESFDNTLRRSDAALRAVSSLPAIDRKIRVRLQPEKSLRDFPVRGLVMLADHAEEHSPAVTRLAGLDAFLAIRSSLFRPWLGSKMCAAPAALRFCGDLQARIPVYRFARYRSYDSFPESVAPLLTLMRLTDSVDLR
jgi:hypothetical protein